MIWDGTSPLRPEHEVAYRGWPTKRVEIFYASDSLISVKTKRGSWLLNRDGRQFPGCKDVFDLIPLQQEQPK